MKVIRTGERGVTVQSGKQFYHFKAGEIKEVPEDLGERLLAKTTGFHEFRAKKGKSSKEKDSEEEE
ncbi:MAG: hypothetical protein HXS43_12010 [Theionarchaea archaeon]|nr:hypothetical protein [Theionarchaea archaeon]